MKSYQPSRHDVEQRIFQSTLTYPQCAICGEEIYFAHDGTPFHWMVQPDRHQAKAPENIEKKVES